MGILYIIGFVITFFLVLNYHVEYNFNTKEYIIPFDDFITSIFLGIIFPITWFIILIWCAMENIDGKKN